MLGRERGPFLGGGWRGILTALPAAHRPADHRCGAHRLVEPRKFDRKAHEKGGDGGDGGGGNAQKLVKSSQQLSKRVQSGSHTQVSPDKLKPKLGARRELPDS